MRNLTSHQMERLALGLDFPPLKIQNWIGDPVFKLNSDKVVLRPDYLAEIEWENKFFKFAVEINTLGTPKKTFETVNKLKRYVSTIENSEKYYPLIIVPYLNEESLDYLMSEKMSGLDLSGNGIIFVPGKIFVYKTGSRNKFSSSAPIKNIFRGVSSLVGRVFFAKPEYSAVGDVLEAINKRSGNITLGTVSKALKALEEELIISRQDGIRLVDGLRLLKNLRENYQKPQILRTVKGKSENLEQALAKMSDNAGESGILWAVNEPQRYAVFPTSGIIQTVYTEDIDKIIKEVGFDENNRFPNLELIETREPTVYFDRRRDTSEGIYFTSPVQVYLELANAGKREKDTAEQIAENILNQKQQGG